MSFIRTIENKVEDCTTAVQLDEVLKQYSPYLYNSKVAEAFVVRLDIIKDMHIDEFSLTKCKEVREELTDEIEIAKVCGVATLPRKIKSTKGRKKDKPVESNSELRIQMCFNSSEGKLLEDATIEIIKVALEKALGKKREAARILGMEYSNLNAKIRDNTSLRNYTKRVKRSVKNLPSVKKF